MKVMYFNLFDNSYRELYNDCTLNIKGEKGNNTIVTIDKGRKEYLLPTEQIKVLKFISNKEVTKQTLFLNGDDYSTVIWNGTQRVKRNETQILEQFTEFGKEIYNLNQYGKQLIQRIKNQF